MVIHHGHFISVGGVACWICDVFGSPARRQSRRPRIAISFIFEVPGFSRSGYNAELPHQAQLIHVRPAFDNLTADDAVDVGSSQLDFPTGCRNLLKLAPMCTTRGPSSDYRVTLCDLILDGEVEVRKSRAKCRDALLCSLATANVL